MNKKLFLLASGLVLCLSVILGISLGAQSLPLDRLLAVLFAGETTDPLYRIFVHVRLPRVLGAVLAGSSLAVSGAMLQSVLENPLASPNIIGVNTGAGICVLLTAAFLPAFLLPMAAFVGALTAALIVLAISLRSGLAKLTLILAGFAVSSVLGAGINTIMILYPDAYIGSANFLVGGLASLTLSELASPAFYIILGLISALLSARSLNIIALGADTAASLGMNVTVRRLHYIGIAAVLAGAAVSFAGLLGFVGLIVPHAVRFLIGSDCRYVLPASIFLGAALVTLCDLLSRVLFAPYELPVGIMLAFIGGTFFIALIVRERRGDYD
jgi:iron complex transport system permease protein